MPEPQRTYTYAQLAQRITEELGVTPGLSTLRAARAEEARTAGTHPRARPRITTAMPAPLTPMSRTAPTRFDAAAVEIWLAAHPWRAYEQRTAAYRAALASSASTEDVVASALGVGLSWAVIAQGLREVRGDARGVKGIYAALRHLGPVAGS